MCRKICIVTGTRAEYGIMKSLIRSIAKSPTLDLQIVATGTHCIREFGYTLDNIISDGFHVDAEVPMIVSGNTRHTMAMSIGVGIVGMTQAFSHLKPDVVVVLGDRFEILSAAIAAVYSGYVLAHLSGGDTLSAGYDEYTRHAITKLAHLHFPFTEKCAQRIIRMGEDPRNVFPMGSPAIDTILHTPLLSDYQIKQKYHIPEKEDFCLIVQHPISTNPQDAKQEMEITLKAVSSFNIFCVIIYPNADPGSHGIVKLIEHFVATHPNVVFYRSVPFEDYLALMKSASVMVGNSSSAILEAPSFCLPAVNIGTRQDGREQGGNIINVPSEVNAIKSAIYTALYDEGFRDFVSCSQNPYGDGNSGERIAKKLEEVVIDSNLFRKQITY